MEAQAAIEILKLMGTTSIEFISVMIVVMLAESIYEMFYLRFERN
jgi:hypothetical protein